MAQGAEAGGHGASRGTFALVPAVADAVGDRAVVVAAGGVADGRGLAAALMLGAEGVVLGTRLYASQEAAGHERAKARMVAATGDDTVRGLIFDISRQNLWPLPFTGRCLDNAHSQRWRGREIELMQALGREAQGLSGGARGGRFRCRSRDRRRKRGAGARYPAGRRDRQGDRRDGRGAAGRRAGRAARPAA